MFTELQNYSRILIFKSLNGPLTVICVYIKTFICVLIKTLIRTYTHNINSKQVYLFVNYCYILLYYFSLNFSTDQGSLDCSKKTKPWYRKKHCNISLILKEELSLPASPDGQLNSSLLPVYQLTRAAVTMVTPSEPRANIYRAMDLLEKY